jgi:nucleoside-diphosphate-sugar epimerase
MLHVDDAVAAFLAVGASLAEPDGRHHGGVWNAGSDEATSVLDLVRGLAHAAGRPDLEPEVLGTPDPAAGLDRQVLDSSALRAALGWRPRWSLEDGLRDTYLWYAEQAGAAAPAPAPA